MRMNVHVAQPAFAQRLRDARSGANLTKAELADRAGLSFRTIHELERGSRDHVQEKTLRLLAEALGMDYDLLRTGGEEDLPPDSGRARTPALPRRGVWWLAAGVVLTLLLIAVLGSQPRLGGPAPRHDPPRIALRVVIDTDEPALRSWEVALREVLEVGFRSTDEGLVLAPSYLRSRAVASRGAPPAELDEPAWLDVVREVDADYAVTVRLSAEADAVTLDWVLLDGQGAEIAGPATRRAGRRLELGMALLADLRDPIAHVTADTVPPPPPSLTGDAGAFDHHVAGLLALRHDEFGEASEYFAAATASDPEFAMAWLRQVDARVLGRSTHEAVAVAVADEAWRRREVLSLRDRLWLEALRHEMADEHDAALDGYAELVRRWPEDKEMIDRYVTALGWVGRWERGNEVTTRSLEAFPDDAVLLLYQAYFLGKLVRCDEAHAISSHLVAVHPENVDAWVLHAHTSYRIGETARAVEYAREALRLDPEGVWAQIRMAVCQLRNGDLAKAAEWYGHVASREDLTSRERAGMLGNLVACYRTAGRCTDALRALDRYDALLEPEDSRRRQRIWRARIALARGDTPEARAELTPLLADGDREARELVVALDAQAGDVAGARAGLASLEAEREPGGRVPGAIRRLRAEVALAEGRPDEAYAELEAIPGFLGSCGHAALHTRTQGIVIRTLVAQGRLEEAIAVLETHLARNRQSAGGYRDLARLLLQAGRPDEAAQAYGAALAVWADADPDFPPRNEVEARLAQLPAPIEETVASDP